jgi:phosphoglucosamine mutase
MSRLFGTDGIRARAGEFPLNPEAVVAIGQAVGEKLPGRLLVGQDTRLSSPWIFDLLCAGLLCSSAEIESAGVVPTPAVALLTREHGFSGGLMISASHNPYDDNGIKIFSSSGRKLSDSDEVALESRILELLERSGRGGDALDIPHCEVSAENSTAWPERYATLLRSHFAVGSWLQGMHAVIDCANGAMSHIAPSLLRRLGARVTVLNAEPTGTNINSGCGAVHLDSLAAAMRKTRADFGVAFDGDGDRSMFISANGRIVDGDAVLLLMARRLKQQGRLQPHAVIGTLMTNFSLERLLAEEDVRLTRVAVGDRFIFEEMQKTGAVLGGEPSGHVIFSDFGLSGDGLLTTLKVAEAIAAEGASLEELTRDWVPSPQLLQGVRVRRKVPLENMTVLQAKMAEALEELRGRGRLVIRYSGTEPLLRVMIESDDEALNERLMRELLTAVAREFAESEGR